MGNLGGLLVLRSLQGCCKGGKEIGGVVTRRYRIYELYGSAGRSCSSAVSHLQLEEDEAYLCKNFISSFLFRQLTILRQF